ncbi:hypothetical protein [Jiangella alba]|uniref:Uncharacterized protein n=1 Tax=Jiangella alba TaxID=561176 RepID=A0A1H5J7E7_9ACTN|nr:hypothetical protein [Jiangella alba]SEE48445.1 hypothetical protein SAMN04488561_1473 [Jiangella alba]
MAKVKFEAGMLVKMRPEQAAEANRLSADAADIVGEVVIAYDDNGDIHAEFPRFGMGVFRPEELEIVHVPPPPHEAESP